MGLSTVFQNGVETAFSVFSEAVVEGSYVVLNKDGFDDSVDNSVSYPVRVIVDSFTQEDIQRLAFAQKIQPTDLKCIIPGVDVPVRMVDSNHLIIPIDGVDVTCVIVDFDLDPFGALYTVLARK